MKALFVEDNRVLSDWLAKALRRDGWVVECSYDGVEADLLLQSGIFDLVILDLKLPKMEGLTVLRRMRERGCATPVLILTASGTVKNRIDGLDVGADDYLVKPFEVEELEARMRALLRRVSQKKNPTLGVGSLTYDTNSREFSIAGQPLSLPPREHAVLEALLHKMGTTLSKHVLADSLSSFGEDMNPDAIEIYVHRLRKKLEASDVVIMTLRGLGYLLRKRQDA